MIRDSCPVQFTKWICRDDDSVFMGAQNKIRINRHRGIEYDESRRGRLFEVVDSMLDGNEKLELNGTYRIATDRETLL